MELILLDLKKKLEKEKSLRNRILLQKAIKALDDYQENTQEPMV
jgi:hypothetical protein